MINECLQNKIMFVENLSKAVEGTIPNIDCISYVVFENKERGWTDEFAVVYYRGGAVQARNCNMNSSSAIFQEIATMLDSSQVYPQDTERFKKMTADYNTYKSYSAASLI